MITSLINWYFIYKVSGDHVVLDRSIPNGANEPQWLKNYYRQHAENRVDVLTKQGCRAFLTNGFSIPGALY